jgi:hypothetical protein
MACPYQIARLLRIDDIPLALAQMRYLHVEPTWLCMLHALTFIAEIEGPSRRVLDWDGEGTGSQSVRDEGIMRRWLENWLGDDWEMVAAMRTRSGSGEAMEMGTTSAVGLDKDDALVTSPTKHRKKRMVRRRIVPSEQDVWAYRHQLALQGRKLMQML